MTKRPVLMLGAGGHARACIDVLEQAGAFHIVGVIGLLAEVGTAVLGYPVLGSDGELASLLRRTPAVLVTVGQIKTPDSRIRLHDVASALGAEFPTVVSPRGYVSPHAQIGAGTIVMHGATVNAGAIVGRNCIVNSHALIEHDATIGDHCHISTSASVNSGVVVGDGTFVGSGARVRQGLRLGSRCVIGMGQVVVRDCPEGTWMPRGTGPA